MCGSHCRNVAGRVRNVIVLAGPGYEEHARADECLHG